MSSFVYVSIATRLQICRDVYRPAIYVYTCILCIFTCRYDYIFVYVFNKVKEGKPKKNKSSNHYGIIEFFLLFWSYVNYYFLHRGDRS